MSQYLAYHLYMLLMYILTDGFGVHYHNNIKKKQLCIFWWKDLHQNGLTWIIESKVFADTRKGTHNCKRYRKAAWVGWFLYSSYLLWIDSVGKTSKISYGITRKSENKAQHWWRACCKPKTDNVIFVAGSFLLFALGGISATVVCTLRKPWLTIDGLAKLPAGIDHFSRHQKKNSKLFLLKNGFFKWKMEANRPKLKIERRYLSQQSNRIQFPIYDFKCISKGLRSRFGLLVGHQRISRGTLFSFLSLSVQLKQTFVFGRSVFSYQSLFIVL